MSQAYLKSSTAPMDIFGKLEEIDKNSFMKMAINDENETNTLLSYYRSRLADFDNERREWLEKLETLRQSQEEKHKIDWELQKRKEEISEQQKSLSELKLSLFDERQQILKLKKENDLLRMKEIEDRKKIAELLSMTNSVEEEVIMYKDLRPDVHSKTSKNDLNIYRSKENYDKTNNSMPKYSLRTMYGPKPKNVVKTIYLPNEQLNSATIENESLRSQLQEQTKLFTDQIETLKEELVAKMEESRIRTSYDKTIIESLENKLHKTEQDLLATTRDYFSYRVKANDTQKRLQEESELLRLKNAALANKMMISTKQQEIEYKVSKELAEKRTDEYTSKYRSQIRNKEESLQLIKDQYSKIQEIYLERIKELEENLTKISQKYNKLEQKRNLEVEGFKEEIRRLKSQNIMRIKPELLSYSESLERPEKLEKNPFEEKETKFFSKEDIKETKKKDFKEFKEKEVSPIMEERIHAKVKEEEDSVNESVNLEELENIKKQLDDLESKLDIKKQK